MNSPSTRNSQWRALSVGVIAGVGVLLLVTVVQHYRHGWPFSLHHDMASQHPLKQDVAKQDMAGVNTSGSVESHASHARAAVSLEDKQMQSIGVRLERVQRDMIKQPLRAVANVVPDESRVSHVHARVSGWLENLFVNTTGQPVRAGEPLAAVFSQDLFATQTEYLSALNASQRGPGSAVVEGARTRLKVLGMTEAEIAEIEKRGEAQRLVTLTAPRSGVVLHRGVSAGTAVDPSTEILTVADLSQVWVWAEVPESAADRVVVGTVAQLEFPGLGSSSLQAKVDFIYPTLTERTRTLRVRFGVPNVNGNLRPGLFGTAIFQSTPREALLIARDAVVDTGLTQHVFRVTAPGQFEPQKVVLGARLSNRVEILEGLSEGDEIVASGVFLLDSESRLRASGGAGTGHSGHGGTSSASVSDEVTTEPNENDSHSGHGE